MLISHHLARFARELTLDQVPAAVRERAKLLILDALGIALASSRFDFAAKAYAGLSRFGRGPIPVIGMGQAMALRDAAMMNGILVHGLDYDDTYLPGSVHMTASNVPCALALGAEGHASGADFLAACIVGLESGARIGRAGQGNFHKAGFHPTALCSAFSCALLAGRLMGLDEQAIVRAQGIALSMASGSSSILPREPGRSACIPAGPRKQGCAPPISAVPDSRGHGLFSKACTVSSTASRTRKPAIGPR